MNTGLDLRTINELTAGKLGVHDTTCPLCSPTRKPANRRKRVLRIGTSILASRATIALTASSMVTPAMA